MAGKYGVSDAPAWLVAGGAPPGPGKKGGKIVRTPAPGAPAAPGTPVQSPALELVPIENGLAAGIGFLGTHYFVPLSPTEFVDDDDPDVRLTFTGKGEAKVLGLRFTNGPLSLAKRQ